MKNLFNLDGYDYDKIVSLIKRAQEFKNGKTLDYGNLKAVNLFYEPSTRTHYSFVSAQQNFNMKVTNVNMEYSSIKKGESLYDTVKTFEALGYDLAVIRHPQNEYYKQLDGIGIPILSGGDGTGNHPTQSLLDLMTIYERFNKFAGLKIAIVGDIMHSRVAHTNAKIMEKLGMEVFISGPESLNDNSANFINYEEAIHEMDVIMLLRVQFERHGYNINLNQQEYLEKYGLTADKVAKMKDNAIIMHPAPFNRGTEISDEVVECDKSVIFEQMTNGVYMRMALIDEALRNK